VINRAREQYDKTKATLVACSNCSTPLTKPLTIDLTDDNSNNNNCGPTDNGLQDAIASSEQLMTLLELAVPSLERELGRGTSMKGESVA
jgi:hypothetical protein